MNLGTPYPFQKTWSARLLSGGVVCLALVFILVFLQPFDTYQSDFAYKTLKLAGYALPVLLALLLVVPVELAWYRRQRQWRVGNELVILLLFALLADGAAYAYHYSALNGDPISLRNFAGFSLYFALPFFFLILPLLAYLRFRTGTYTFSAQQQPEPNPITVFNYNETESISFLPNNFLFAEAQHNYVRIYYQPEAGETQNTLLRLTLSDLADQLAFAERVHRSYLVNLTRAEELSGNKRQSTLRLAGSEQPIPVSPKHYQEVRDYLQRRP